ncbi:4-hydroxy-2-oxoglutarate aldolase, mitochondrial-like [Mytilus trossulus]|uniref:4-hydroxy-2-oxoglutarate aldolase, mitochondrial-like n=1 Tax=Mytilus trossulus TaxID=6551 RepID=UPI003007E7E7
MSHILRRTIHLTHKSLKRGTQLNFSFRCASTLDISGVYPPIATPFNADESIAYDKLERNLQQWNTIPFKGYVVQGSNGEYAYLTPEERVEMMKKVVQWVGDKKLIIAGSGCESTRDTVSMTQKMADVGAKAALVVTPCYYKGGMNNTALINHYTKVADTSPIPVILYSVPGNTAIDLAPEVIIKLSEHKNIIGLKDSGGDIGKLGSLVYATQKNDFQILAGSASFLFPAYAVGCVGGVLGLANVLGKSCCDLEQLYKDGKMEEAKQLQHRLIAPNMAVTKRFGVPGLKVAMEWFGYYGGPTRSPLQPIGQSDIDILRNVFKSNGFLD